MPLSIATMYTTHFHLDGTPFSIAPDPRFLYMSAQHREALAHLLYGVDAGGGFVLLTGEVGAGKTTVCRCLLQQAPPRCRIAYIFNPRLSAAELLQAICEEFGIALPGASPYGGHKEYVDALNRYLLDSHAQGNNNVLVIDEAQNLSADVLEQLRLLTNLETSERKLLQIVLIGQPELRELVGQPALTQLSQRIIARYHLGPLSRADCRAYIIHRLAVAGARSAPLFSESAMRLVHQLSGGVPRCINLLCDRAMLAAYAGNRASVDAGLVRRAANEVFVRPQPMRRMLARAAVPAALAGMLLVALAGLWFAPLPGVPGSSLAAASNDELAATMPRPVRVLRSAASGPAALAPSTQGGPLPASAAAQPPANVDTAVLLGEAAGDESGPLQLLAKDWGVPPRAGLDACTAAVGHDLHCYRGRGGLAELRLLDRPAVLRLRGDANQSRYVLLRGMSPGYASVEHRGGEAQLPLMALEARFTGEFSTFWRMPAAFRSELRAGERGADVDWVAARLAALGGEATPDAPASLDRKMLRRVRQFQLLQGLEADSVIGPRTWMRLNAAAGVPEPRLASPKTLAVNTQ
ncbi:MAG: peptidoglycan-binding protein [Paucimonas sp.]|nr:peptidoglycan-binding protein [Paucimonas sp.]